MYDSKSNLRIIQLYLYLLFTKNEENTRFLYNLEPPDIVDI